MRHLRNIRVTDYIECYEPHRLRIAVDLCAGILESVDETEQSLRGRITQPERCVALISAPNQTNSKQWSLSRA